VDPSSSLDDFQSLIRVDPSTKSKLSWFYHQDPSSTLGSESHGKASNHEGIDPIL
jgi:hypothetical protein